MRNIRFLRPAAPAGAWLCLLLAGRAPAALAPADFPFVRPLVPPSAPANEVGAFVPDADLFDALDDRLGNLRVFDAGDREVPFLLRRRIPSRTVEELVRFPASQAIRSLREREHNRLELIVERDARLPLPAALEFESGLRNFEKLVTVSGSRDGEQWNVLAENEPIYDYSRFADVRRDRIRLVPGDYTLYRIELSNVTEQKDSPLVEIIRQTRGGVVSNEFEAASFRREPFRINHLTFYESRRKLAAGEPETAVFAVDGVSVSEDAKRQQTIVRFSTRRQPVCAVTLLTRDMNFSRAVTLEGQAEAAPAHWQTIARGRVDRIHVGKLHEEHLAVSLPGEVRYRHYRMTIHNEDNPPLTVTGLEARQTLYEALFFPKRDASYRVCWGGERAEPPRYDVAAVLSGIPAGSADPWQLGPVQRTAATGRSWKSWSRAVLIATLAAMTVILAAIVVRLARKVESA